MEFRILGPLDICSDNGHQIPLPRHRQRAVLSLLLLRAGHVVTRSALISDLWGRQLPIDPNAALRNSMYEVRRAIGMPGRIQTCSNGYIFHVNQGDYLDLQSFRALRDEGEKALEHGDLRWAAAKLDEAVSVWREPALADSPPSAVSYGTAKALLEERALTQQLLIETMLALGHHRDAVVILFQLTASDPLRERWWELLMLALYRCGDQAAALEAYRQARSILAEKCGIDPGPHLQSLQQDILTQRHDLRGFDAATAAVVGCHGVFT